MRPSRPRVLIVDDQAANVDVLAEALGETYELFAATSAERALELANQGVDLVLLDVVMPDQNGFELCRALKANDPTKNIPVIFVTALGEVEDEARGFDVGGVDYITKPISPPTVRARVRTHLELRGAQRRLEKEAEVLAENLRLKEHVERLSRHDLKTPLTSVISIPQILLESPGLSPEHARMLRAVETAGYRILDMVNRSLDLFRMESGTYEFHPVRVDLSELAERVTDDLKSLARERQVSFALPPRREDEATASAEELLTYSMLANLIKNAVEASPAGGIVSIELEPSFKQIRVTVRNQGAVPLSLRETFFRKYSSSGKKSGTGLGAYSARLMAETQRGRIEMTSSEEDGTTVSVWLERAVVSDRRKERRSETAEIRTRILPGVRVLVVDDDEPTRFVLARFLQDAAAIAFAEDGNEAVRKAEAFRPSVIFLDAEMPGMDGFAAASALRAQEAALEIPRRQMIGLSSHDDAASSESFRRAGCDLVLVKPVTRGVILAAVASLNPQQLESGSGAGDEPDSETVLVEADLLAMIPAFLESRKDQARDLCAAIEGGDVERARSLAHKLRGGLEMCGFAKAGAMSRGIEEAVSAGRPPALIAAQAQALRAYLDQVRYEARKPLSNESETEKP